MSFFFQDEKIVNITKNKKITLQESNIAEIYGCVVCPLNMAYINRHNMEPTGTNKPIFYILGEAPGETEDITGTQFAGQSGQILRNALKEVLEVSSDKELNKFCRFNNIVRCRPCKGKANRTPEPFEIACCKQETFNDIEETQPLVVLGFGNIPLKTIVEGKQITQWRGRRIPVKFGDTATWYFPMYHPSFILRNRRNGREGELDKYFKYDLQQALKFVEDYQKPEIYTLRSDYENGIEYVLGTSAKDYNKITEWLEELKYEEIITVDIETLHLKPWFDGAKMLSIAIGTYDKTYVIPLSHNKAWQFSGGDIYLKSLYEDLKLFLKESGRKIVFNLKFELEWFIYYFGKEIVYDTNWDDAQALPYILDGRTSREEGMFKLDIQIFLTYGFRLKELSDIDKTNPEKSPINELLLYNGMDVKWTHKYFIDTYEQIISENLVHVYQRLVRTVQCLSLTEAKGLLMDVDTIIQYQNQLSNQIKEIEEKVITLPEIIEFNKIRKFKPFNILSNDDLIYVMQDILKLPEIKKTKEEGGKYSVDKYVLGHYADKGVKLCEYISLYKKANKLKSTYLDSIYEVLPNGTIDTVIDKEGLVHPEFNIYFVSTGRLSSGGGIDD